MNAVCLPFKTIKAARFGLLFVVLKCRVCEIFRTFRFSRFLHVSFFKSSTFRFAGFSKHKDLKGIGYKKYDNFEAIEVTYTDAIPNDYNGIMGVPISFLDKYCPEQFEIVGITKTWFGMANKTYPKQIQVSKTGKKTVVTKLNDGPVMKQTKPVEGKVYYIVDGCYYTQGYARILIRKKQ